MAVVSDIAANYVCPRRVFNGMLARKTSEGRVLAMVFAGCAVTFIGQWPRLARDAHFENTDIYPLLGGALMGWMLIAPLLLYLIAYISHAACILIKARVTAHDARLALFWAFLASSPLMLLYGLTAGFIGPGRALDMVGLVWCGVFLWFWIVNLRVSHGDRK